MAEQDNQNEVVLTSGPSPAPSPTGEPISITIDDIKRGDAGNSYDNKKWVRPWFNIDKQSYISVRGNDTIIPVLNSNEESQYTRYPINDDGVLYEVNIRDYVGFPDYDNNGELTTDDILYYQKLTNLNNEDLNRLNYFGDGPVSIESSNKYSWGSPACEAIADFINTGVEPTEENWREFLKDSRIKGKYNVVRSAELAKYLRLIMPKYMRRVEVEDLNRNFWVIGQTITGITAALYGDNSCYLNLFNGILDEITQLWENVLYLWAGAVLVSQKETVENVRCIHCYLDSKEVFPLLKYDNFEGTDQITKETYKTLLKHYKEEFPETNLAIIPEIRYRNYKHNYYAGSIFPCIYYYNVNTGEEIVKILKDEHSDKIYADLVSQAWSLSGIIVDDENSQYKFVTDWNLPQEEPCYGLLRSEITNFDISFSNNQFAVNHLTIQYLDIGPSLIGISPSTTTCKVFNFISESDDDIIFSLYDGVGIYSDTSPVDITKGFYQGEIVSYLKPSPSEFKVVRIGDLYPEHYIDGTRLGVPPLTEITLPEGDSSHPYDTATYGIGAYTLVNDSGTAWPFNSDDALLKFVDYYDLVQNGQQDLTLISGYDLTSEYLDQSSINYIIWLKQNGKLGSPFEDGLYATKFGCSYWNGVNGSQWSSSIVHALIYYSGDGTARVIGHPQLFDGYWTTDTAVFYMNGSQWRRLYLGCSVVSQGENKTEMYDGKLVWYDHWNDIQGLGNKSPRPNADMKLNGDRLVFSNPINELGQKKTNMALTINYQERYNPNEQKNMPYIFTKTDFPYITNNGPAAGAYYDNGGPIRFDDNQDITTVSLAATGASGFYINGGE